MLEKHFGINLNEERALRRTRIHADHVMVWVCWALWVAALCFAVLHNEWYAALAVGTPAVLLVTLLAWKEPGSFTSRMVIAFVFMVFSGLLIHESHGLIEAHFSIFALIAFLLYYRDWRPILFAAGTIAMHHFVACRLQMAGHAVYVFPPGHGCNMVYVHAAYVVVETVVLAYLSWQIRREALESAAIEKFGQRVLNTGVIDLRQAGADEVHSEALDKLLRALDRVVKQNLAVAGGIDTVSGDVISAAGLILNAGQEQQASSESAVAVVRRMAGTAEDVTRHCGEIATVARGTAETIVAGRQIMSEMAATIASLMSTVGRVSTEMDELRAESRRIEGIIRIMSDIARQTDLLALNATIEAAASGQAGRGFAVVAQEIRELSTRTHSSLQQAQGMVDQVRQQIGRVCAMTDACRKEAADGGRQVQAVNAGLAHVLQMLPQIAKISEEMLRQARTYNLLSEDAVEEMRGIGKTIDVNSSNLRRIDLLGQSLGQMSGDLLRTVKVFKVSAA